MTKCNRCPNEAEFVVMLEDDENPHKHYTQWLCANCVDDVKHSLIEQWTIKEWLEYD